MILFVDDHQEILDLYSNFLKQHGYQVLACTSPIQALELFQQYQSSIKTVISDYCMPELNGLALINILQSHNPNIQAIMITGYSDINIPKNIRLIEKPFSVKTLLNVLSERGEQSVTPQFASTA